MKFNLIAVALFAAAGSAYATPPASSSEYVEENGNAITLCRGALPTYETALRSRPLAIVNEGTANAYVNCGFRWPSNDDGQEVVRVGLHNYSSVNLQIYCTGVFGVEDGAPPVYIVKSVGIAAGQFSTLAWSYADNGNQRIKTNVSVQCVLPPGTGITELLQAYRQK